MSNLKEPACVNHHDKPGVSHFGNPYAYSLCIECLDKRVASNLREPLDEHGKRMLQADADAVTMRGT